MGTYIKRDRKIYKYYYLDIKNADGYSYVNLIDNKNKYVLTYDEKQNFFDNATIIKFLDYCFIKIKYNRLREFYLKKLVLGYSEKEMLEILEEKKEEFGIRCIISNKYKSKNKTFRKVI